MGLAISDSNKLYESASSYLQQFNNAPTTIDSFWSNKFDKQIEPPSKPIRKSYKKQIHSPKRKKKKKSLSKQIKKKQIKKKKTRRKKCALNYSDLKLNYFCTSIYFYILYLIFVI